MTTLIVTVGTGWENESTSFQVKVDYSIEELQGCKANEYITKLVWEMVANYVERKGRSFLNEDTPHLDYVEPWGYCEIYNPEIHGEILYPFENALQEKYK